jgi:hypothetical protein
MAPGTHILTWNAAGLPSGIYLARLRQGVNTVTKQILLMK